jgi:hypothetical protein
VTGQVPSQAAGNTEADRIRLDRLLFMRNVPAGMDWAVLGYWAVRMRKSNELVEPISIRPIDGTGLYRVVDGRHRAMAAYIAGRDAVEYTLDA